MSRHESFLAVSAPPKHTNQIDIPAALVTRAQLHHGLIDYSVARRLGIDRATWRALHRNGSLVRIHHNVASLPQFPSTPARRIGAAVLSIGNGAMASHRSAAFLWDLRDEADEAVEAVDLTVKRTGTPSPAKG